MNWILIGTISVLAQALVTLFAWRFALIVVDLLMPEDKASHDR